MKRKAEQLAEKFEPADIRAIQDLEQGWELYLLYLLLKDIEKN